MAPRTVFALAQARWAAVYLLMIPLFAFGYFVLPARSFVDSNIKVEASIERDATRLANNLRGVINEGVGKVEWTAESTRVRLGPRKITNVGIRRLDDGRIVLQLAGDFENSGGGGTLVEGNFIVYARLDLEQHVLVVTPAGHTTYGFSVTLSNFDGEGPVRSPIQPPLSLLLPGLGESSRTTSNSGTLVLSSPVAQELLRFANALQGDPSFASGLYGRMLYLSATTITTLGPGDITPVSGLARWLVGLEAVLGVVVIGLFLNALARRIRDREEPPRQPTVAREHSSQP
jgi:Ion channel